VADDNEKYRSRCGGAGDTIVTVVEQGMNRDGTLWTRRTTKSVDCSACRGPGRA
jgi:hypothetical protein